MRKVKYYMFFLIVISFSNVGFNQSETAKYLEFKLYKNVLFELGQTRATRTATLGTFSPAIAWGKGTNFQEIQLTSLSFRSRAEAFSYSGGAEYTYNHRFSDGEGKVRFYFGGGIGGGFSTNFSSIVSSISGNTINTTGKDILFHVVAIPRITYQISPTILLDISTPYHVYDFQNSQLTARDPAVPSNQQTNTVTVSKALPRAISVKAGGIILF